MTISMTDAGKRFNREWIFRHVNREFVSGKSYAITGPNGSGKSTMLLLIAGALHPSEGSVQYLTDGLQIGPENQFRYVGFCAPYLELVEEMTASEFLRFHCQFKPFLQGTSETLLLDLTGLKSAAGKQIRYFSSGMKQRLKLAQAILSDTEIVLLDEPCTNLDKNGISVYHKLIETYCRDRLVIVSSNDPVEYQYCGEVLSVQDYR
jgi:ABC-type multidrug transport system ATPase subunit